MAQTFLYVIAGIAGAISWNMFLKPILYYLIHGSFRGYYPPLHLDECRAIDDAYRRLDRGEFSR
jgi:hypothetical protein